MFERIMGVITLKAPVYRQIADDQNATGQAAIVLIIVTLIQSFFTGLVVVSAGTAHASLGAAFVKAIVGLVIGLIAWVFTSWVLSFVAGALGGKTSTGEMLRVTGFVQVFSLVNVLTILILISPVLACVTGLLGAVVGILSLVGYIIGVREAAEFTTGKAIITSIIAVIINLVIILVIGGAVFGLIAAAMSLSH